MNMWTQAFWQALRVMGATGAWETCLGKLVQTAGMSKRDQRKKPKALHYFHLGTLSLWERESGMTNDVLQVIFHVWGGKIKEADCGSVSGCTHRGAMRHLSSRVRPVSKTREHLEVIWTKKGGCSLFPMLKLYIVQLSWLYFSPTSPECCSLSEEEGTQCSSERLLNIMYWKSTHSSANQTIRARICFGAANVGTTQLQFLSRCVCWGGISETEPSLGKRELCLRPNSTDFADNLPYASFFSWKSVFF